MSYYEQDDPYPHEVKGTAHPSSIQVALIEHEEEWQVLVEVYNADGVAVETIFSKMFDFDRKDDAEFYYQQQNEKFAPRMLQMSRDQVFKCSECEDMYSGQDLGFAKYTDAGDGKGFIAAHWCRTCARKELGYE